MQMYVCVLCASCGSSQYCVRHHLQFVITGRGCKRQPYGRGILQSRSHDCLVNKLTNIGDIKDPCAQLHDVIKETFRHYLDLCLGGEKYDILED